MIYKILILIFYFSDSMIRSRKLNYNYDLQNEHGQEQENISLQEKNIINTDNQNPKLHHAKVRKI